MFKIIVATVLSLGLLASPVMAQMPPPPGPPPIVQPVAPVPPPYWDGYHWVQPYWNGYAWVYPHCVRILGPVCIG